MNRPKKAQRRIANRLQRIHAHVDEIEHCLTTGSIGPEVLMALAKARGEINSLIAEMLAGRIHVLLPGEVDQALRPPLASELMDLLRPYLK